MQWQGTEAVRSGRFCLPQRSLGPREAARNKQVHHYNLELGVSLIQRTRLEHQAGAIETDVGGQRTASETRRVGDLSSAEETAHVSASPDGPRRRRGRSVRS